jgi:hypothetical protein
MYNLLYFTGGGSFAEFKGTGFPEFKRFFPGGIMVAAENRRVFEDRILPPRATGDIVREDPGDGFCQKLHQDQGLV